MRCWFLIVTLYFIEDTNCHNETIIRRYQGLSYNIKCGEHFFRANKYVLRFNGITLKKSDAFFVYKLHRLESVDTGIYSCSIYQKALSHYSSFHLIVMSIPNFKSIHMIRHIAWKKNTQAKYDCELNSTDKFKYQWLSQSKELLKSGPHFSFKVINIDQYFIYCSIIFDGVEIYKKAVSVLVRENIGAPLLEYIESLPNGFFLKWYPPTNMKLISYTQLSCYSQKTQKHLKNEFQANAQSFKLIGFNIGDTLLCSLFSRDNYGDSPAIKFKQKIEDITHNVKVRRLRANFLTMTSKLHSKFTKTVKITENILSTRAISLELTFDDKQPIIKTNVSACFSKLNISYSTVADKVSIVLKELSNNKKIIGKTDIFTREKSGYPKPRDVVFFKINDHKAKIRFYPYFGFAHDYCVVNVIFLETNQNLTKIYQKSYIAYRGQKEHSYILNLINLYPNTLYKIQFRYQYIDSPNFSDLSDSFSFATEKTYIVNPMVSAFSSPHNMKIKYYYPSPDIQLVDYSVIRIHTEHIKLRIFGESSGQANIRLKDIGNNNMFLTIQYFSAESKSKEMVFEAKKRHEIDMDKTGDLFGIIGFILYMLYVFVWFVIKIINRKYCPFIFYNKLEIELEKKDD
ncbi:hypothetical protein HZS_1042 [Henneguya salminicola]|nr:hypothetical protein HZS_1042 [Henneguya salminicola]